MRSRHCRVLNNCTNNLAHSPDRRPDLIRDKGQSSGDEEKVEGSVREWWPAHHDCRTDDMLHIADDQSPFTISKPHVFTAHFRKLSLGEPHSALLIARIGNGTQREADKGKRKGICATATKREKIKPINAYAKMGCSPPRPPRPRRRSRPLQSDSFQGPPHRKLEQSHQQKPKKRRPSRIAVVCLAFCTLCSPPRTETGDQGRS